MSRNGTEMHRTPRPAKVANLERKRAKELSRERRQRGGWYWLGFANNSRFLGGAIVWEHGFETATLQARKGKSGLPDGRHHRRLALEHRREHPIPGGGEEINRLFVRTGRSSAKNLAVRNVSGCMKVWRLKGL